MDVHTVTRSDRQTVDRTVARPITLPLLRFATVALKKAKINGAYDFFSYSKDNFEYSYEETDMHGEPTNTIITRKYVWIPRESIEKDREETRTVPGTRKLHMVRGLDLKTESILVMIQQMAVNK